ncbi:MAG: hypothetical protein IPP47_19260 [Bryobacterales bacterium]|nr:hypothetical protein [Bryobacterales bacterium]
MATKNRREEAAPVPDQAGELREELARKIALFPGQRRETSNGDSGVDARAAHVADGAVLDDV